MQVIACPAEWQGGCYHSLLDFSESIPINRELLSFHQGKESDIQGVQQNPKKTKAQANNL